MKWDTTNLKTRLYLISSIILLAGLSSAILIYQTAENNSEGVWDYETVGGNTYLISPDNSKKHVHDIKLIGGNAALIADEFSRWFNGLWKGKSLAITVACIVILISLVIFLLPESHRPTYNLTLMIMA